MKGSLSGQAIPIEHLTIERLEKIVSHISNRGECWVHDWTHRTGYAYAVINKKQYGIHRILKAVIGEPISLGKVSDHTCGNKACVNPRHIEEVSQAENIRRGTALERASARQLSKTHCPQGHPYDQQNTYVYKGWRQCYTCRRFKAIHGYYANKLIKSKKEDK